MVLRQFIRLTAAVLTAALTILALSGAAALAQEADLVTQKFGPTAPVALGTPVAYTITVTNAGPDAATTVDMTDILPAELAFINISAPGGWICTTPTVGLSGTVNCTIALFGAGSTANFTINALLFSGSPGAFVNNTAVTTSAVFDPADENNSSTASFQVAGGTSSDLSVTKSAPAAVLAGGNISYSITARNSGPDTASAVTLSDVLATEFVSLIAPAGWFCTTPAVGATGPVSCTNATLAVGAADTFTLVGRVPLGAVDGDVYENTATISSAAPLHNEGAPENNSATTNTTVTLVSEPDLLVTKSHPAGTVLRGASVTFTLGVSNVGTGPTSGTVTLVDTLPPEMTATSLTGAGWSCNIGTLTCTTAAVAASGVSFPSVTLIATVQNTAGSTILNTAQAFTTGDVNLNNNAASDTVQVAPVDLSVTKTGPAAVAGGGLIGYAITVNNTGADTAANAVLTDALPAGVTFVSLISPGGWSCTTPAVGANGTISCTNPAVASGSSSAFTLNAMAPAAGGTVTNTATIASNATEANTANNSSSQATTVAATGAAPTATTLTSAPNPSTSGTPVTFTATVTDADPAAPTGSVTFSDGAGLNTTRPLAGNTATLTIALTSTTTVTATYNGDATFGGSTSAPLTQVVQPAAGGALSLSISFGAAQYYAVGQTFEVRYLVTNTGTTPVTGISVSDPKVPGATCPATTLAPGTSMTCTGTYTVTAADITAGSITFTATVTGSGGATATASATINSGAGAVAAAFDALGTDFVETRSELIGSFINPPGLNNRGGSGSFSITENNGDPTLNFAASLLQTGAGDAAESLADGRVKSPFNIWIDGTLTLHTRNNGGGNFGAVGLGADYLVTEDLLLGAALYLDMMTDVATLGTVEGRGVLAGPYISVRLAPSVTFDASLFYGRTWNDAAVPMFGTTFRGSFVTDRLLAKARLDGKWTLDELVIRPDATLFLSSETAGAYTVRDTMGNAIAINGFTSRTLNLSGGTTIERPIEFESGLEFVPEIGFRLGISGSGTALTLSDPYGSAMVGFRLAGEHWTFQSAVEGSLFASSLKTLRYRAGISGAF